MLPTLYYSTVRLRMYLLSIVWREYYNSVVIRKGSNQHVSFTTAKTPARVIVRRRETLKLRRRPENFAGFETLNHDFLCFLRSGMRCGGSWARP